MALNRIKMGLPTKEQFQKLSLLDKFMTWCMVILGLAACFIALWIIWGLFTALVGMFS